MPQLSRSRDGGTRHEAGGDRLGTDTNLTLYRQLEYDAPCGYDVCAAACEECTPVAAAAREDIDVHAPDANSQHELRGKRRHVSFHGTLDGGTSRSGDTESACRNSLRRSGRISAPRTDTDPTNHPSKYGTKERVLSQLIARMRAKELSNDVSESPKTIIPEPGESSSRGVDGTFFGWPII